MNRAPETDLASAAHAALAQNQPMSAWDETLRHAVAEQLGDHHFREARFLLALGAVIAVLSLAVDYLVAPEHLGEIALLRLGTVLPLTALALLLPRRLLGLQKAVMALSLTAFAFSLAYASLFVPSPSDALLALGVVTLLGLSLPVLPYRGWELVAFIALYLGVIGSFVVLNQSAIVYTEAYIPIMLLTTGGAAILAHRVHWLERRNLLLTLEAEGRASSLENSNARLTELSMEDPLTGLANRRRAENTFAEHYASPIAAGQAGTALFMLDLDHFKDFNDRWGHQAGDTCLRSVAEVMRHTASKYGGLAARFGGEEFLILLRADDKAQALSIAEELRVAIERIEIDHAASGSTASCSTSIGIALHEGEDTPALADMLARADAALYRAKAEGRNRCLVAD